MFTVGAGSETTASTIRFTMLNLITTPRVYQKLKQTVSTAVKDGLVSNPIRQEEAKELPYLQVRKPILLSSLNIRGRITSSLLLQKLNPSQAVIYEGLRMRPPVPLMFPKVVPPQGDVIDGKFIPGGTAVGWNLLSLMRSPDHWGADAELFRPERFLEVDEETRGSMERLVELVFGYGRFACAGKPLAMMELSKTYFEVSISCFLPGARDLRVSGASYVDFRSPSNTTKPGLFAAVPTFRLSDCQPGESGQV